MIKLDISSLDILSSEDLNNYSFVTTCLAYGLVLCQLLFPILNTVNPTFPRQRLTNMLNPRMLILHLCWPNYLTPLQDMTICN